MALKHLGLAVVDACRIQPNRFDLSIRGQPSSSIRSESWKVKLGYRFRTSLVSAQVFKLVIPILRPPGLQQHNRVVRNLPVALFPRFEIRDRNKIIRVSRRPGRHVYLDRGPNQPFKRYMIDGLAAFGEMHGGVDVSASVFSGAELIGRIVESFVVDS